MLLDDIFKEIFTVAWIYLQTIPFWYWCNKFRLDSEKVDLWLWLHSFWHHWSRSLKLKKCLDIAIELCVSCQLSNVLRAESRFTSRGMRSFFVTLFFGFFLLRTSLFSLGSSNSFNVVSLTLQNNHICTLIPWNSQIWSPLLTNFMALQISKSHF